MVMPGDELEGLAAIENLTAAIEKLGLNEADTNMGAIELLAKEVKEGSERIASELSEIRAALYFFDSRKS